MRQKSGSEIVQNAAARIKYRGGMRMAGYILAGMLAAFGIFCGFWVLLGHLLPGGSEGFVVCRGSPGFPERYFAQRIVFLTEIGLLRCPLLVVDLGLEERYKDRLRRSGGRIEICTPEELSSRLELERKKLG